MSICVVCTKGSDYVVSNRSLQQAEEELWCIFQAARLLKRNHVASIEKVLQNT